MGFSAIVAAPFWVRGTYIIPTPSYYFGEVINGCTIKGNFSDAIGGSIHVLQGAAKVAGYRPLPVRFQSFLVALLAWRVGGQKQQLRS